jgi:hypothetical protein
MITNMSSDLLLDIDRLDSQQLRANLAKLEQQRSALIVLLRAAVARERKQRRPTRRGGRRDR